MISIIIPTLNESNSIDAIICSITNKLEKGPEDFEIIISDDDSPDKTWEKAKKISENNKRIKTLRRFFNKGLSNAVVDGFRIAKGELLLVIDADGQHDESIIIEMIKYAGEYDIVIGSRYLPGSSIKNWSLSRMLISKAASYIAYPLIKNKKVSDPLSGFFLIKKDIFVKVHDNLRVNGFKILLDILLALPEDVKIKEVPYVFKNRIYDKSKMKIGVVIGYINFMTKEYAKKYLILTKFIIVGTSGTIVNIGLLFVLVEFYSANLLLASFIAIEASIINNFLLNNFWTFYRRNINSSYFKRFVSFNAASISSLFVNVSILLILTTLGLWYIISHFIGIISAFLINFIINNYIIFKNENK